MIISSWHLNLIRVILSDEALVDELVAGGEFVDDLVESPDGVVLRDLFLTGGRTEMLRSNEA